MDFFRIMHETHLFKYVVMIIHNDPEIAHASLSSHAYNAKCKEFITQLHCFNCEKQLY